jgi:tetratricopeptide (TPR) repeat protein
MIIIPGTVGGKEKEGSEAEENSAASERTRGIAVWRSKARNLSDEERREESLRLCRAIALRHLQSSPDWEDVGVELGWMGRREDAAQAFREALAASRRARERHPRLFRPWFVEGMLLVRLGRSEEAIVALDRALALKPEADNAMMVRARALTDLGRHAEAEAEYRRITEWMTEELNPRGFDVSEPWHELGDVLYELDRPEEALTIYCRVRETFGEYPLLLNSTGAALYKMGRYAEALAAFGRATSGEEFGRKHSRMWRNLGIVLCTLQRREEAGAAFAGAREWAEREPVEAAWDLMDFPKVIALHCGCLPAGIAGEGG